MTTVLKRPPLYRRPEEIARRAVGSLLELGIKAYGAAAAVSVGLSNSETVGGKSYDALNAVPNLVERYREAKYLVDHRVEIQATLDYVHQHAPDADQMEQAARRSSQTLERISTTYSEFTQARDTFFNIRPNNVIQKLPQAKEHFEKAWAAKPDLDSIEHLAQKAEGIAPFFRHLDGLNIDFARLYGNVLSVTDNFASDEIGATLGVMAAALTLAYVLGMGAGFWGRRGRPGFVVATLQRCGARVFRGWYARNFEHALGRSMYAAARERVQHDVLADPQKALDPEAFQELERYFERRRSAQSGASAMFDEAR